MSYALFALLVTAIGILAYHLRRSAKLNSLQLIEIQRLQEEKRLVFAFIHDIGEAFAEDIDRDQLLHSILACSMRVTSAASGIIYLKDPRGKHLIASSVLGIFPPPVPLPEDAERKLVSRVEYLNTMLKNETIDLAGNHPFAEACRQAKPLFAREAQEDPRFPKFKEPLLQLHSLLVVPLKYRDETLGLMALANHESGLPFSASDFDLARSVAEQAAFTVYNASIYALLAEKKKLDHDLKVAREVQRILLPAQCPNIQGYDLAALNIPAQHVSGDYYDFVQLDEHHHALIVADVSGKGVPASLIMAMCRIVVRTRPHGSHSPAEILRQTNRILTPDIREDMFITLCCVVLDTRTHELRVAKAGHEAPLLRRAETGQIEHLKTPGMAIGIDKGEVFDVILEEAVVPMKPGDSLLLYTDGLNEALNDEGQEFGIDRVKGSLALDSSSSEMLINNLIERVVRFRAGHLQSDDITLIALQRL